MNRLTEKRFLPQRTASADERRRLEKRIRGRLSQEAGILFAYLHGSFVTGESFRDIDVGIYTRAGESFSYESDLSCELSQSTGNEVEVRVINRAPVAFQMAVLRDGELLFSADEDVRTDFIEATGRRYREYAHFRNIFMEAIGAER
jgi:hypothetical protein